MKIMNEYFVYILTTKSNASLYIGVTNDLMQRIYQHKAKQEAANLKFTKKYNVNKLVYYEIFNDIELAIGREKQLKKWNRDWKVRLIEKMNPSWIDLYESMIDPRQGISGMTAVDSEVKT